MKIILTRHGETLENKQGIIQGQLPGTLSEQGIAQAKKLGERLAGEEVHHIYASDLARAVDTAAHVIALHEETPVTFEEALREQYFGSWQGKTHDTVMNAEFRGVHISEDGESFEDLLARAQGFVRELRERHGDDETVVIVGHARVNRAVTAALMGEAVDYMIQLGPLQNTSVCIFEVTPEGAEIVTWDCIKHLDEF